MWGMIAEKSRDFARAAELYESAIERWPGYSLTYFRRAKLAEKRGNLPSALEDYTKVIQLDNDYALARFQRGSVYCDLKRYDEAVHDFEVAVRKWPKWKRC